MDFVTVKDVELCSAGMDWPSAGGLVTLTLEHIADCVLAGQDSLITPARLKIGHTDPRFADPNDPGHDPFYDGEPAFGSIGNLRLTNDGATATGDYVNVPLWLAEGLPAFYPSRSIEGAYSIVEGAGGKLEARWDVETPAGRTYSFVLTANALLGVQAPAVKDIEDLQFRLTEGEGVIVTGDPDAGGVPIAVSMGAVKQTMTLQAPPQPVALSGGTATAPVSLEADVDKVIDVFYSEFCVDDRYWWWARAVRVDPNVIIADDDEGSLWTVPINTDADQNITFGDPVRVLQTFTPAPEAAAVLAAAAQSRPREGRTLKAFAAREQTVPADRRERPEGGVNGGGNNSGMDFSELSAEDRAKVAKRLGLSADATDEQLKAALLSDDDPPAGDGEGEGGEGNGSGEGSGEGEGSDSGEGEGAPAEGEGSGEGTEGGEGGTPPADASESPTVSVDKTVLAELQAKADRGDKAFAKLAETERGKILDAALSDGKITPASRAAWETKLKGAPEATAAELAALPKDLVPVTEVGHGGSSPTDQVAVSADEMGAMFPGHGKKAA